MGTLSHTAMVVVAGNSIVLTPNVNLVHPRYWQSLPLIPEQRYDTLHCLGAGSLLLWLLVRAKRSPRVSRVVVHGDLVLPTPESCDDWASTFGVSVTSHEWRTEALLLGLDGALPSSEHAWLAPILQLVANGRTEELAADMHQLADRWAATGRLVWAEPAKDAAADSELCVASSEVQWCVPGRQETFAVSTRHRRARGESLWPDPLLPV